MKLLMSVVILKLLCVSGQYPDSPCPEIFGYEEEDGQLLGVIKLEPSVAVSGIIIRANFTIAATLPSSYMGRLEPLDPELGLQRYNQGETLVYRVYFPKNSQPPRLYSLVVNHRLICDGPMDISGPDKDVSMISLRDQLHLKSGVNNLVNQQINSTKPRDTEVSTSTNNEIAGQQFTTQQPPPQYEVDGTQRTSKLPRVQPRPTAHINPLRIPSRHDHSEDRKNCGVVAGDDLGEYFIPNGYNYARGEWPWLVAIYKTHEGGLRYLCAGTLVSDRHVVTAAQCMKRKNYFTPIDEFVVKLGVYNLNDWGDEQSVMRTLESAIIHESFNTSSFSNDILVFKLSKAVDFSLYIRSACLWYGESDLNRIVGASGIVPGWGRPKQGPGLPRMIRMPIVSTTSCHASNPTFIHITSNTTFCAGGRDGVGPCVGDSGAGMYLLDHGHWRLRGFVSLSLSTDDGEGVCNLSQFIVFTDVAKYVPWITNIIESDF